MASLGFGNAICFNAIYDIRSWNIDCKAINQAVIDIQDTFTVFTVRIIGIHRAILEINSYIRCATFVIDIDNLTGRIKCASVEGHYGRTVRPDGIISARTVKRGILKLCGSIAPVEGLAIDYTILNNRFVRTSKAEIVRFAGLQRHLLELDRSSAVKTVITVVFRAKISRIGHFCADIPTRFVGTLSNKGQVLALSRIRARNTIECVLCSGQHDGVAAFGCGNSRFQRLIRCFPALAYIFVAIIAICSINIDRPASTWCSRFCRLLFLGVLGWRSRSLFSKRCRGQKRHSHAEDQQQG